jgi:hypothetical protein
MENQFDRDEFELFLQENIDQFTLQAKESVWKKIYAHLHLRSRNYALFATFLLMGLFIILLPFHDGSLARKSAPLLSAHPLSVQLDDVESTHFLFDRFFAFIRPQEKAAKIAFQKRKIRAAITGGQSLPNFLKELPDLTEIAPSVAFSNPITTNSDLNEGKSIPTESVYAVAKPRKAVRTVSSEIPMPNLSEPAKELTSLPLKAWANLDGTTDISLETHLQTSNSNDLAWLKQVAKKEHDYRRKNRLAMQFYFSPTISFRELEGQKDKNGVTPLAITSNDVNRFVNQSPSLGLEVGTGLVYNLSERLNVKAGVQMNLTRYNIQAFRNPAERTTILLNNNSILPDTLSAVSTLRSLHGDLPETIHNQYFQVSIPVGVEFKVLGNKAFQFNVAGSIQPGYMLAFQSYLLNSDYTNYTQQSSLMRRWNVSTSLETYFSYQKNGFRWQIGPQFRYQLLSSFKTNYNVKEYLMEYGIKFGFTRVIR